MSGMAADRDFERDEALVCHRHHFFRRLGHDRSVGRRAAHERLRADAADLLVGDCCDDHIAAQRPGGSGSADEHDRGEGALHVARAAPVQLAVCDHRLERSVHARYADRVHVRVQQERASATRPAGDAHDVRSPGRGFVQLDLEPGRVEPSRHEARDLVLAGGAGDQIGVDRVDRDQVGRERCKVVDERHRLRRRVRRTRARRRGRRPSCDCASRSAASSIRPATASMKFHCTTERFTAATASSV